MSDETPYSNRELREFFKEIKETLSTFKDDTKQSLSRIEVGLDRKGNDIEKLKLWRSYIAGGIATISIIGLPIIGYMFLQLQDVSKNIIELNTNGRIVGGISTSLINK